ncbi:hypothetical protein CPB86DRAFT_778772 [Serendipita vermifera]|nr:hypothetical protein CPB86DRAFT_778772 [Serendipita vermifera]
MATLPSFPSTFTKVPAPWNLKAEAWWFVLSLYGKTEENLSPSWFAPLESHIAEMGTKPGAYRGGLGVALLIRYHDSEAGPYDELLVTPGAFTSPPGGKANQNLWITRAYVSTPASVVNGRANWNVPKHLARFEFTPADSSSNAMGVRVYACKNEPGAENADHPVFSDEPFFAVELKNTKLPFPALPMNTKIMPYDLMLVQPALKPSKEYEKDGLVGTSAWMSVLPTYTGKIKLGYVKGLLPGGKLSNGVDFPDIRPWSTVIHWPSCDIVFPPAHVL